ncbi:hypothetical protein H4S14_000800 [Agrobacterium vitis]|nr:hypothetical protein [Agrobacterium vitis]MBE1437073.1 hypothetical protein [Agrobacterium vitis]
MMDGAFERLARSSRRAVERVHGKAVMIFPLDSRDANASPVLDAANPPYPTVAMFYEDSQPQREDFAQPSNSGRRLMQRSAQRTASIRLIEGQPLKTGFYMRRESDQALFTISSFDADGVGNVMAVITTARSLPPPVEG